LEEAEIDENTINIYVDRQRRLNSDNVCSTSCMFNKVVRIDNQGNIVE